MQITQLSLRSSLLDSTPAIGLQVSSGRHGEELPTRRAGHGGIPWSMPYSSKPQLQPQDGAAPAMNLTSISSRMHNGLPQEPEDARLTGGTRSLTRRVLGLNVMSSLRKIPQAQAVEHSGKLPRNAQVA